jgi:hypothetical protein
MSEVHGASEDFHQFSGFPGREGVALDLVGQTATADILQGEVRPTLLFAYFMDLHNPWMLKSGNGFGLAAEAVPLGGFGVLSCEDHLEGDQSFELEMASLVDHSHAAPTQFFKDLVARHVDGRARWLLDGVGNR